nr:hypothetical protein [Tanacetum cinerariifolium]
MWSDQEKKIQKIDRLARSFLIQGLSNDIYSLIDSNKTAKDLWDALARHMLGFEYGEQDRKATVLYEYETFKATEGEFFLDTYIRYLQVINDLKKCGYSKDNCELNFKFLNNLQPEWKQIKKKTVMFTSDPLALIAEKTKSANKKQEFVKSNDKKVEKKDDEKKQDMSKVKCYNCKKERHFAKDCKKVKVKDYEYYETRMLLVKKDKDEQILLAEDQAWTESSKASSSSADDKISEISYYLFESESKSEYETSKYYDNTTTYATTFEMENNELNEQMKVLIEKNDDFLAQTNVLKDKLQVKHVAIDTHVECQEKYAKLEAERYEYMIRYSAYFDNDKQHRKQIADQEVLYDKMSVQLVELDKH